MVYSQIEADSENSGNTLSENRGNGSAFNPHGRESEIAEDQDRIQNNIDQGAGTLGDHGIECFARGLQYPFKDSLKENTE